LFNTARSTCAEPLPGTNRSRSFSPGAAPP
jgi:hypothetical protein